MKTGLTKEEILEIELELTGTCNLHCPLCTRSYENAKHMVRKNIRPLSEITEQLDGFPNLKNVCLAGLVSEPTMYKEFTGLIKYLVGRNITIELYSNANTHTKKWWRELGELFTPTDRIYFTVCGSTQELHEKYRVGSKLSQVLAHAEEFRKCGKCNDYIQHIKFEYNAEDLKTPAMQAIIAQFSNTFLINSLPYQERFGIIKDESTDIKMTGDLAAKYNTIKTSVMKRYDAKTACKMRCKSFETQFISIDNFGDIHPCFLYRMYKKVPFDHTDYTEIFKFTHDFCYECESLTTSMLERNGLERMG